MTIKEHLAGWLFVEAYRGKRVAAGEKYHGIVDATGWCAQHQKRVEKRQFRLSIDAVAENALDAPQRLVQLCSKTGKTDLEILFNTGMSHNHPVVATHLKIKPAILRKKLDRPRINFAA